MEIKHTNRHIPTALGIIVDRSGDMLTFERTDNNRFNEQVRGVMAEATVPQPRDRKSVLDAIQDRFDVKLNGGVVLGRLAFKAKQLGSQRTARLFVPVTYAPVTHAVVTAIEEQPEPRGHYPVWKNPRAVLGALSDDDSRFGIHGRQRREIAIAAVFAFLESRE